MLGSKGGPKAVFGSPKNSRGVREKDVNRETENMPVSLNRNGGASGLKQKADQQFSRSKSSPIPEPARADGQDPEGTVFLEIDAHKSPGRRPRFLNLIAKAEQNMNISFGWDSGKAAVLRELHFKKRNFAQGDNPMLVEPSNVSVFREVAKDLGVLYKAFPGPCKIVRLCKPISSKISEERELWLCGLAQGQGECMAHFLCDYGVSKSDLTVDVAFAGPGAPAGMYYFDIDMDGYEEKLAKAKESQEQLVRQIVTRGNVHFDYHQVRCRFSRNLPWMPRHFNKGQNADPPTAELEKNQSVDAFLDDMFEVWRVFRAPSRVLFEFPVKNCGSDVVLEDWLLTLGRNRAALVQQALEDKGIPADMLHSGMLGDCFPDTELIVEAPSSPHPTRLKKSQAQVDRIKVKNALEKAAVLHRIEDIPVLEEALDAARLWRLEEQWTRVDPLISEAEQTLQVLYQRRQRHKARCQFSDRRVALARIKVSTATQEAMYRIGELSYRDISQRDRR